MCIHAWGACSNMPYTYTERATQCEAMVDAKGTHATAAAVASEPPTASAGRPTRSASLPAAREAKRASNVTKLQGR